jgi:CheY-like chemotaxis protein
MQPKVIAIIDDEPEMEDLFLLILENLIDRELVSLHFFPDGLTFFTWFRKNRPDLLLCDINLPGMDGSELVQEIRRLEHAASIPKMPISFVSGHHPEHYADVMGTHQVTRFISKPLNARETLAYIERDLGLVSP